MLVMLHLCLAARRSTWEVKEVTGNMQRLYFPSHSLTRRAANQGGYTRAGKEAAPLCERAAAEEYGAIKSKTRSRRRRLSGRAHKATVRYLTPRGALASAHVPAALLSARRFVMLADAYDVKTRARFSAAQLPCRGGTRAQCRGSKTSVRATCTRHNCAPECMLYQYYRGSFRCIVDLKPRSRRKQSTEGSVT